MRKAPDGAFFIWWFMLVLNLCKQYCPDKIPVQPGERLNDGADGEVFVIADEPTKVIKFSVIYDREADSPREIYFNQVAPTLQYLLCSRPSVCAIVYEYGFLGEFWRKLVSWRSGTQNFILHYYIMERLHKLSEDEKKVFHSLVSHEDQRIEKDLAPQRIKEICRGLARGLDFDIKKVILFCEQLRESPLSHLDIHPRNIMVDNNGYFKLVDFDRCFIQ